MRTLSLAALAGLAAAADNGLARKPTLGINLWNSLFCNYNVTDLEEIAQLVVSEGYAAAGYKNFNLDDCWQVGRQPNGTIIPDPKVWGPAGIQPFFDFVHGLGLRTGVYSDAGTNTCAGRPGVSARAAAAGVHRVFTLLHGAYAVTAEGPAASQSN
jgi:alpha-galactosidase